MRKEPKRIENGAEDLKSSVDVGEHPPAWFRAIERKVPGLGLFPHCKLGEGFAQFAIGSDTGCMLIWQIDADTNVDVAAFNLEKAKENLVQLEPYTEQVMVFLLHSERRIGNAIYEARNILCQTEKQLVKSASEYFSEKNERIRMGKMAYGQGCYESAISLLRNADRSKDADAQFMVGQMYAKGRGVARDPCLAQKWFWKAAKHGHAGAALEVEKALRKEERELRRSEDKIVAEIEEFTKQLLADDE